LTKRGLDAGVNPESRPVASAQELGQPASTMPAVVRGTRAFLHAIGLEKVLSFNADPATAILQTGQALYKLLEDGADHAAVTAVLGKVPWYQQENAAAYGDDNALRMWASHRFALDNGLSVKAHLHCDAQDQVRFISLELEHLVVDPNRLRQQDPALQWLPATSSATLSSVKLTRQGEQAALHFVYPNIYDTLLQTMSVTTRTTP